MYQTCSFFDLVTIPNSFPCLQTTKVQHSLIFGPRSRVSHLRHAQELMNFLHVLMGPLLFGGKRGPAPEEVFPEKRSAKRTYVT